MKITFLGQAGLLFENNNSKILIDPYLSDSIGRAQPEKSRSQPIDERFLRVEPTAVLITHCHADHYDKETLAHYLCAGRRVTVFGPNSVWEDVRTMGGENNYVLFNAGTRFSLCGMRLYAVRAEHSDPSAIGVVLEDRESGARYYVTGDTLYSERVFSSLPQVPLRAVFLPVNGAGNNMNMEDAAQFSRRTRAEFAVPLHCGMFDDIRPEEWEAENKVVPKIYQEVVFP